MSTCIGIAGLRIHWYLFCDYQLIFIAISIHLVTFQLCTRISSTNWIKFSNKNLQKAEKKLKNLDVYCPKGEFKFSLRIISKKEKIIFEKILNILTIKQ